MFSDKPSTPQGEGRRLGAGFALAGGLAGSVAATSLKQNMQEQFAAVADKLEVTGLITGSMLGACAAPLTVMVYTMFKHKIHQYNPSTFPADSVTRINESARWGLGTAIALTFIGMAYDAMSVKTVVPHHQESYMRGLEEGRIGHEPQPLTLSGLR